MLSRRHQVTILCGKYPGAKDSEEGPLRVRFVGTERHNYILSTFSYALQAARFVRRYGQEFDIVVEDFAPWNPVFSVFLTQRPTVLHVNHREGLGILRRWLLLGLPFYILEAVYPKLFRHVAALSEGTREKIGLDKAVIIPAGLPEGLCDTFQGEKDEGYLMYVGRLHIRNKGLDTLLEGVKASGASLLLSGKGRDEAKLREMAERLGLKGVVFAGFLGEEEKLRAIARSTALVLPSRFEGQGIVILEAAACGRPVIVSDIPELRYAVDAGFGLFFRTGDSRDLAEKIRILFGDASLRREMGRRAREYAAHLTWEKISERYEAFLEGLVSGKSS
jgi:glycosyltransferase involved in cell wall biosynthesis